MTKLRFKIDLFYQLFPLGSHKGSTFKPKKLTVDEKKTYYLCGCKETEDPLGFCDGTHRKEKGLKKYTQHLLKINSELKEKLDQKEKKINKLHICAWTCGSLSLLSLAIAVKFFMEK